MEKAPNIWEFLEGNKQQLNEYIELRVRLFSLQLIRKISTVTAMLIWLAVLGIICFLITLFTSLTLGFYLAQVFNSFVTGFAVTTLIILFVALLLILLRKKIFINPIIRIIIREQTRDYEPE